ncbi:Asp23/Gls24 family envelope stress response protein [Streptomyces sp. SID14478]|uniref:Asp23/Gls24 family envelope stress response protein n=1 Tax=Streptomyces sp. SID14478 TaxID=2706073 RepID=UPI0013E0900A|nr:Asp23/Gls24 family envelope stress response protein [Streptomyces sp. SID14478]NEB81950.1 Asp23/Gls24 family envelope stress response protein [Streptomyces sp. SID14478]
MSDTDTGFGSASTSAGSASANSARTTSQNAVSSSPAGGSTSGGRSDSGGTTTIADNVIATIAGIAIRGTDGVHSVGKGTSKALGAVAGRVSGGSNAGRSVKVAVDDERVQVDVDIEVEYGMPIHELADHIRTHVTDAVETMTGLDVGEVNINVFAVHVFDEDEDDDSDG